AFDMALVAHGESAGVVHGAVSPKRERGRQGGIGSERVVGGEPFVHAKNSVGASVDVAIDVGVGEHDPAGGPGIVSARGAVLGAADRYGSASADGFAPRVIDGADEVVRIGDYTIPHRHVDEARRSRS